jgi:hypothetical protein
MKDAEHKHDVCIALDTKIPISKEVVDVQVSFGPVVPDHIPGNCKFTHGTVIKCIGKNKKVLAIYGQSNIINEYMSRNLSSRFFGGGVVKYQGPGNRTFTFLKNDAMRICTQVLEKKKTSVEN